MIITLQDVGRRYNQDWIFRHIDYTFSQGKSYAILGPNGSGKSTLLKVLSGSLASSEGKIHYAKDGHTIAIEAIFQHLAIAAPYIELIEEFSLSELIDFHFTFRMCKPGFDKDRIIELLALPRNALHKEIKYFSSGMKQRVRLALACCTQSEILLLDEPTSNLDQQGENWYFDLLQWTDSFASLLIIGSNQEKEYDFCDEKMEITAHKSSR